MIKTRSTEDLNALTTASNSLRLFHEARRRHKLNRLQTFIILILASFAASPDLPDQLSAKELLYFSGYADSSTTDIDKALKRMTAGEERATVTRHKSGTGPALYSLSGTGASIARDLLQMLKLYKSDLQVFAGSIYEAGPEH